MRDKIKMLSTGKNKKGKPTGTFRVTTKNKKKTTAKLELQSFDARAWDEAKQKCGKHVLFVETKI